MIRSELDVLLDKVQDEALRADLRTQIDRLKQRRSFGLVFEQHIPERVRLPQHPIRIGSQVFSRDDADSPTYEVLAIEEGLATVELVRDADGAYAASTGRFVRATTVARHPGKTVTQTVHAMTLRRKYQNSYEVVMRCHER